MAGRPRPLVRLARLMGTTTPETAQSTRPRSRWRQSLLGIAISLVCLILIFRQIDATAIYHTFTPSAWPFLVLGLSGAAFGYTLRIWRWALLLRAGGAEIGVARCVAPYLASIALNNVLPMRAGDVVRGVVFPSSLGVKRVDSVASLIVERMLDLLSLLACLGAGALVAGRSVMTDFMVSVAVGVGSAAAVGLVLLGLVGDDWARSLDIRDRRARLERWLGHRAIRLLREVLSAFGSMSKASLLLLLLPLSILAWFGEAVVFLAVPPIVGFRLDPVGALLVMAMATLSTLVPSSPGYVGTYHLAAFSGASLLGATPEQSAAFAILVHLAVWLPTTVAGAVAIMIKPDLFGRSTRRGPAGGPFANE